MKFTMIENNQNKRIRWLEDLGSYDVTVVGGKNASLGEMIRSLKQENTFRFEACDGIRPVLSQVGPYAEKELSGRNVSRSQSPVRSPVKEPPNEPKKPPVEEPEEPIYPPPPPSHPPVKEPPNEPEEPPVKEPPPRDPDREPPQQPPIRAAQNTSRFRHDPVSPALRCTRRS